MKAKKSELRTGRITKEMSFNEKVWAITARIEAGKVATYGDVAKVLGTKAYRAVGNALNRNPYAPEIPCHRVVGSNGALTGFAQGLEKKRRMLEAEGIAMKGERVDLAHCRAKLG